VFGLTGRGSERGRRAVPGRQRAHYHQPVYPGDSLRAESEVLDRRSLGLPQGDSASSPGTPRGFNQREELVIDFKRTNLVRLRNAVSMPYITEERRMIQEQAREFTLNEVLPVANKLDPEKGDIPMDLRDKMAGARLLSAS
jgi:hypothetical protein